MLEGKARVSEGERMTLQVVQARLGSSSDLNTADRSPPARWRTSPSLGPIRLPRPYLALIITTTTPTSTSCTQRTRSPNPIDTTRLPPTLRLP